MSHDTHQPPDAPTSEEEAAAREALAETAQCKDCHGKGWNDEWKANDHHNGGEVFRIECATCEGSGVVQGAEEALIHEMAAHAARQTEDNPRHGKDTLYPLLCKEFPDAADDAIFQAIDRAIS